MGPDAEQLGILPIDRRWRGLTKLGMDLVEVSPMAKPPVCKIMDYGKFKYTEKKKQNEAKKKQVVVQLKEVKLRPRTEEHDYDVKPGRSREFLQEGEQGPRHGHVPRTRDHPPRDRPAESSRGSWRT